MIFFFNIFFRKKNLKNNYRYKILIMNEFGIWCGIDMVICVIKYGFFLYFLLKIIIKRSKLLFYLSIVILICIFGFKNCEFLYYYTAFGIVYYRDLINIC